MTDSRTGTSSGRKVLPPLLVAGSVIFLAIGGWFYLRYVHVDMLRRSLAAIDVGTLESQWFSYESANRVAVQAKLQPGADWRPLTQAEHVWVLNQLGPAMRVNDDTAPNLRPDGFRDPWGRMYRFDVRQLIDGTVRFRATAAGIDGQFGTGDDLAELFAVPSTPAR